MNISVYLRYTKKKAVYQCIATFFFCCVTFNQFNQKDSLAEAKGNGVVFIAERVWFTLKTNPILQIFIHEGNHG